MRWQQLSVYLHEINPTAHQKVLMDEYISYLDMKNEEHNRGPPWNMVIVLVIFFSMVAYALYYQRTIEELGFAGFIIKLAGSPSNSIQNSSETPGSNNLIWEFDKDLEGWNRIGIAAPWKSEGLEGAVKWRGEWADGIGVIVIDACDAEQINASAGIMNSVKIPKNAKRLEAIITKMENDGGIRFILIDDSGIKHILGERVLSGRVKEVLTYNISQWAGKPVTLEIMAFGYGTNATKGNACSYESKACCGEYVGVDSVQIV